MKLKIMILLLSGFMLVSANNENSINEDVSATLSSNYYSENWDGEEKTSIAWEISSNTLLKYNLSEIIETTTKLALQFGQTKDRDSTFWEDSKISSDKIDLDAVFNYRKDNIYIQPYLSAQAKSKFVDERIEAYTHFINPFEFTEAAGVMKSFETENKYSLSLRTGFAAKQLYDRYVLDEVTNTTHSYVNNTNGVEFVSDFFLSLREDVIKLNSTLKLFKGLQRSDADDMLNEDWKAVDVVFENTLQININKYLMAKLYLETLYDKEIIDEVRIKQNTAIGLTWNINTGE